MKKYLNHCYPFARSCISLRGFSLIELMISITIGIIVTLAATSVLMSSSSARNELERAGRQIENGRYAVQLIADDLRLAGYWGELNVTGLAIPAALPDPCSLNAADWDSSIPLSVQGYRNSGPACLPVGQQIANTNAVAIRRLKTCTANAAGCDLAANGKPYIQVSLCQNEVTSHVTGLRGVVNFNLTKLNCTTAAELRQYLVNIFYLANNNGFGQNVPTLKKLEFTGSGFTEIPLVEGIEYFYIEYGLDNNNDGNADAYTADPTNYPTGCGPCNSSLNWSNVVSARVHVLARNIDVTAGHVDTKRYVFGDAAANPVILGPFNDGFKRHAYTTYVRLMNPSSRRETP